VPASFIRMGGAGHGFKGAAPADLERAYAALMQWFEQHLGSAALWSARVFTQAFRFALVGSGVFLCRVSDCVSAQGPGIWSEVVPLTRVRASATTSTRAAQRAGLGMAPSSRLKSSTS
jgi:hypothetical protein